MTSPRLHIESWAPEYGTPAEPGELPDEGAEVDFAVEDGDWQPRAGADDETVTTVAFLDGVRRIDARLTLDDPAVGPVPGLCGSFAVGAVAWDRPARRSTVTEARVKRVAILGDGRGDELPPLGNGLEYTSEAVAEREPVAILQRLQNLMREEERNLAVEIAATSSLVLADGPIRVLEALPILGYVKTHRRSYLPPEKVPIIASLGTGERTPIFRLVEPKFGRYSWYLRLARVPGGHSWSGVVRLECTESLGVERARHLADVVAALLPRLAPPLYRDARAPQNLLPIGALERELRRRLGDPGLVYRALRAALLPSPSGRGVGGEGAFSRSASP